MKTSTRNALILFGIAGLAVIIALAFMTRTSKSEEETQPQNVYVEVPEAEDMEITGSKSEAYMKDTGKRSKIEAYWDDCAPDKETPEPEQKPSSGAVSGPPAASAEDLLGLNEAKGGSPAPKKAQNNPYRETAQEREARHQRRHQEAIELAERMQEGQTGPTGDESSDDLPDEQVSDVPPADVRKSDAISSPDGWGSGLSSLDGDSVPVPDDPYTPFRCMFARESKLTDGQRVTVILLDDLTVSGISVPRNTHLMATCQLSNRLELEFANIEIGGRILALGYEAYDIDGSKGIYCPDVGSTGKTVRSRGTDIIGSSLSGRLGRVAREVTSTGISLIQNADGQRTVSVPAGYTFFIVKKRLN